MDLVEIFELKTGLKTRVELTLPRPGEASVGGGGGLK